MMLRQFLSLAMMFLLLAGAFANPPPPVDLDAPVVSHKERIADRLQAGTGHALVIAVRDFTSVAWRRLDGVSEEERDVRAALALHGFSVETIGGDASATTAERIRAGLTAFANKRKPGDRVVIYVASHGLAIPSGSDGNGETIGYLVASDTPASSDPRFARSAISIGEIERALARLPSQHVLLAFNTCFSGSLVPASRAELHQPDTPSRPVTAPLAAEVYDWVATLLEGRARHVMTAGDAEQTVPDVDNPFGRAFVEALLGAADRDGDGLILASELGQYVRSKVALETRRTGKPNDPVFVTLPNGAGVRDGEFVFLSPRGPAGSGARQDAGALEQRRASLTGGQFVDCLDCPVMVDLGPMTQSQSAGSVAFGRTEVTIGEWSACFRAGYCRRWKPDSGGADRPTTNISWGDALDYVGYLNAKARDAGRCAAYRLPRAAEWSAAAAGGASTRYPWGDSITPARATCRGCGSPHDGRSVSAVAASPANGFGLYDMVGNVWEWLADETCTNERYIGGHCSPGQVIGGGYSTALGDIDFSQPANVPRQGPRAGLHEPGWPSVGLRVVCDLDRAGSAGTK